MLLPQVMMNIVLWIMKPRKSWRAKMPMKEMENIPSQMSIHLSFNILHNQAQIDNNLERIKARQKVL